jgi:type VI secretion system protein ImpA
MARIDVDTLLQEISEELPCGEDLEYDAAFGELERASRGKPEQSMGDTVVPAEPADWKEVQNLAVQLLSRTKDLRVMLYLTRAQLNTEGLVGLNDSLWLLGGTLEQYWEAVHPQLDPDDDNDPTLRVNTLMSLCDPETVLRAVREAPLVTSRTFGRFGYRDVAAAHGEMAVPSDSEHEPPDAATINAAFKEGDLEELQANTGAAKEALERADGIESFVTEKVGAQNAPNLAELRSTLKAIQKILAEQLSERGVGDGAAVEVEDAAAESGPTEAAQPAGAASGFAVSGRINSRDEVIRALDKVCEYYSRNEPSSPVPMLLRRAQRLVSKDFMEILRDLVPDGVSQAETIRGTEGEEA